MSGDTDPPGDVAVRYVRGSRVRAGDVIAYEIHMLRHCHHQLVPNPPEDIETRNVYLEAYLLHFRALLEFFAHPLRRLGSVDLSVRCPADWATRPISASEIASVTSMAEPLHASWFARISQQLSHCTKPQEPQALAWPIAAMHRQLEAVIAAFERLGAV